MAESKRPRQSPQKHGPTPLPPEQKAKRGPRYTGKPPGRPRSVSDEQRARGGNPHICLRLPDEVYQQVLDLGGATWVRQVVDAELARSPRKKPKPLLSLGGLG
jgi:hypothetical protein